jgi:hyperosmotically inducible protein
VDRRYLEPSRKRKLCTKEKQCSVENENMKRKLQFLSASAASVLALSALAQDAPNPQTDRPDLSRDRMSHAPHHNRLNDAAKASDVIGMTVKNYQDEKLGKVEDLAVDVESGRVVQVILSTGGFIGIGDRLTAVPPQALHHDVALKVLHLNANKEKLKAAPQFEMSKWVEYSDADHLAEVYRLYGQEPAFGFIQTRTAVLDGQRNAEGAPNVASTPKSDGTNGQDRIWRESQSLIPASRLSGLQKATKLMGTSVKNLQDEKLGKVENLLVDLPSGHIVAVIVSSGGFLGLGDELSAVPPTAMRFTAERDTLQLDASRETLSNAPHFNANQWPDLGQPSYAEGVYRAYRVEPYFTTKVAPEPDNTARNVRDRDGRTLTPLDQGHSRADVGITAQIRKEIMAEKSMSVNARNVKIITIDGRVTLRGPVNTSGEKRLIGEIADRIARAQNVDNQLEVSLITSSNN